MTLYIESIPFPDDETAVAYYGETHDIDTYADMFPNGLSEAIAWLRFNHPDMSDRDINTLASAVHRHATRPYQDVPTRASLRALVKGQGIYPDVLPEWEDPADGMASLPPALQEGPSTILHRLRSVFSRS